MWRTSAEANNSNSISVMFWRCIGPNGVGRLVTCKDKMDASSYIAILQNNLSAVDRKNVWRRRKVFYFPARLCNPTSCQPHQNFLRERGIDVLPWPAQSPEDVWPYMKSRLNFDSHGALQTKDELIIQVAEERNNIPLTFIANHYQSIPKRLVQVVRAYGYLTKY